VYVNGGGEDIKEDEEESKGSSVINQVRVRDHKEMAIENDVNME